MGRQVIRQPDGRLAESSASGAPGYGDPMPDELVQNMGILAPGFGGIPARSVLIEPCPASIWLLGAGSNCKKPKGHDGYHAVTIEWTTDA